MPGAVPRTSTYALTGVTLKYLIELANKGPIRAMKENRALIHGLNTYNGFCTYKQVAQDLNVSYKSPEELLFIH